MWEPKRGETEIATKREIKSYSGNDVVAMEMLYSARLLDRRVVGIIKDIFLLDHETFIVYFFRFLR